MIKKDIPAILLDKAIISQDQLRECTAKVATTDQTVLDCLIEMQFVSPDDIARAYAEQSGLTL